MASCGSRRGTSIPLADWIALLFCSKALTKPSHPTSALQYSFTFDDKRLALEALNIKVFVDGNNINIEGAIPIAGDDIASITPRCSG